MSAARPVPPDAARLLGIQYLRAVAALMVAYLHLTLQVPAYTPYLRFSGGFDSAQFGTGVDVFFVISGFIMVVTSGALSPGRFLLRRLVRIAPLYWLLTLALVVIAGVAPSVLHSTRVSPAAIAGSLAFVPFENPAYGGELVPILVPGWTLNFEMFFYGLFALALLLPARRRLIALGAVFLALCALRLQLGEAMQPAWLRFYTSPRIFEFWTGMLIAERYLARRLAWSAAACVLVSGLAGLLLLADLGRLPSVVSTLRDLACSALVVAGLVAYEQNHGLPRLPWLLALGDASYSLYLSHVFAFGVSREAWTRLGLAHGGRGAACLFVLWSLGCVVAGAALTYRVLEQPLARLFRRAVRAPAPG